MKACAITLAISIAVFCGLCFLLSWMAQEDEIDDDYD